MTIISINLPYIFTLRARSTKKYNFEEVADFDDIVEDNYEWKSRLGFSGSTQNPSSVYFRNSDTLQEKASSNSDSKSENYNMI